MLIDEPTALCVDPILAIVGSLHGDSESKRLGLGMYQVSHFGGSHFMPKYEDYPEDLGDIDCYGVCDYPAQVLERCPMLGEHPKRSFVVIFHRLLKKDEDESGGWRWHKWGEYIGDQKPQREYLHDEPEIEEVWTYHIHEKP